MPTGENSLVSAIVYYGGRVQGVGFRATTRTIAFSYQVTGQVRNLDDGRVHLIVEGCDGEVRRFLAAVRERMAALIRSEQIESDTPSGEYDDFQIA